MTTRLKYSIKGLLVGAAALAIGIIILNHANLFLQIIMVAAGIGSLLDGVYTLLGIRRWKYTSVTKTLTTIKGVESTLLGFAAIVVGIFAANEALTVMVYIFAVSLIFSSIVSLQNAAVAGTFNISDMRGHFVAEAVIQILIAIILFFKPVETLELIVKVLAIAFIVVGSLSVVFALIVMFSKSKKTAEVGEAEVVEENK
ncbi:MAG: DUF308 domain-containing protein [Spirochaetales bacterium]|nr:DUF308 domain-containing protein [Spirochaetales bacterium]